jgi:mRNA interferase HigB
MHVISKKKLRTFWSIHPEAESRLNNWFRVAKKAEWMTFADLHATFRSADQVGKYTVFDVGGNEYRLIAEISYRRGKVFLRYVLTHADYSRGTWKKT